MKVSVWFLLASSLFLFLLTLVLTLNFSIKDNQHFYYLARSFLQGKLYFVDEEVSKMIDIVPLNNRYYWPQGPLPAVILMPFVWLFGLFKLAFYQGYLQFPLVMGILYLVHRISVLHGFSLENSLYFVLAFLSSAFLGLSAISTSWFYAQVVTIFLLFLAIFEYLNRKRYWLIGVLMGLVFTTRMTASLGVIFFLLEIILSSYTFLYKAKSVFVLLTPFFVLVLLIFLYNYYRFGSPFESGYLLDAKLESNPSHIKAQSFGIFDLVHVPGNLYYFFLNPPRPVFNDSISHILRFPFIRPDSWGMSVFVTSPYLLSLFLFQYKDRISKMLWLTIFIICVPIFLFFGIGYDQFGYRYAFDFMHFIFFLLISNYSMKYRILSPRFKLLILISAALNLYLFFGYITKI